MIQQVEEIRAEFELSPLSSNMELLLQGKIPVVGAGADDDVAGRASILAREISPENRTIEPPGDLLRLRPVAGQLGVAEQVGPIAVGAGQRSVAAGDYIYRRAALKRVDAGQLPPGECLL